MPQCKFEQLQIILKTLAALIDACDKSVISVSQSPTVHLALPALESPTVGPTANSSPCHVGASKREPVHPGIHHRLFRQPERGNCAVWVLDHVSRALWIP